MHFLFSFFCPVRENLLANLKIFAASLGSKKLYAKEHPLIFYPIIGLSKIFL